MKSVRKYPSGFNSEKEWKESQLTPAPDGYSWHYYESIKAFFLFPSGWTTWEEIHDGNPSVFITKNKIATDRQYEVGFSASVIKGFSRGSPSDADFILQSLLEKMKEVANVSEISPRGDGKYFKGYFAEVNSVNPNGKKIHSPTVLLLNLHSGTLYSCIVESPFEEWAAEKNNLETIMSQLTLDPYY